MRRLDTGHPKGLKGRITSEGDSHMKGVTMLFGNFKPLKETNLGVAQPFLTPKSDHFKL